MNALEELGEEFDLTRGQQLLVYSRSLNQAYELFV